MERLPLNWKRNRKGSLSGRINEDNCTVYPSKNPRVYTDRYSAVINITGGKTVFYTGFEDEIEAIEFLAKEYGAILCWEVEPTKEIRHVRQIEYMNDDEGDYE